MLNNIKYEKGIYYFDTDKGVATFNINNGEIIGCNGKNRKSLPITATERNDLYRAINTKYDNFDDMTRNLIFAIKSSMRINEDKIKHLQNVEMIKQLLKDDVVLQPYISDTNQILTINKFLHSKSKEKLTILHEAFEKSVADHKQHLCYYNTLSFYLYLSIMWSELEKRIDKEHFDIFKTLTKHLDIFHLYHVLKALSIQSKESIIKIIAIAKKKAEQYKKRCANIMLLPSDFYDIVSYLNACEKLQIKPRVVADIEREMEEIKNSYMAFCEKEEGDTFRQVYEPFKDKLTFETNNFTIILPQNKHSLIIEGAKMHHCVAGYVNWVKNGATLIVFIRKKDDINTPYITAQINPKTMQLQQYYLAYDKKISEPEDIEFKAKYQEHLLKNF